MDLQRRRKRQKEADEIFNFKLNALIDSQQKTDAKINRLLRRNTNGHSS